MLSNLVDNDTTTAVTKTTADEPLDNNCPYSRNAKYNPFLSNSCYTNNNCMLTDDSTDPKVVADYKKYCGSSTAHSDCPCYTPY